jgi:hypothetical protein
VLVNSQIIELGVANNGIGTIGCDATAKVLSCEHGECKLERVDLSRNDITDKGGLKIWMAIRHNGVLTHLNMEKNPLTSTGVNGIYNSLSDNNTL